MTHTETPGNRLQMYVTIPYKMMLAVCSIIVNFTVLAASISVLKKSLHNILILAMCFSDGLTGVIALLSAVQASLPPIQTNNTRCIFALFAWSLTSLLSPCIVFMIGIERYLVVSRLNFGIQEKLNRNKHLIVAAVLIFPVLVSLSVYFMPHNTQNQTCFPNEFFGEYFATYVYIIYGTLAVLDLAIVMISLTTSVLIWKLFFKTNAVRPYISQKKDNIPERKITGVCTKELSLRIIENQSGKFHDGEKHGIQNVDEEYRPKAVSFENKAKVTRIDVHTKTDPPRLVKIRNKVSTTSTMIELNDTYLPEVDSINKTDDMVLRTGIRNGFDLTYDVKKTNKLMSQSGISDTRFKNVNVSEPTPSDTKLTAKIDDKQDVENQLPRTRTADTKPTAKNDDKQDGQSHLPGTGTADTTLTAKNDDQQNVESQLPGTGTADTTLTAKIDDKQDVESQFPGTETAYTKPTVNNDNKQDVESQMPETGTADTKPTVNNDNKQDVESQMPETETADTKLTSKNDNKQDVETQMPETGTADIKPIANNVDKEDGECQLPGTGTSDNQLTAKNENKQDVESQLPKEQHNISWEVKAFGINVMISLSTILLTGPFVASFWLEAFNIHISLSVKFLFFTFCLINYTLDPILYVLGFPGIKDKIKNLHPCKNTRTTY